MNRCGEVAINNIGVCFLNFGVECVVYEYAVGYKIKDGMFTEEISGIRFMYDLKFDAKINEKIGIRGSGYVYGNFF